MAKLRPHVDAFFDKVTVNVADGPDKEKLRENRLNEIRDATRTVADFSRIEGWFSRRHAIVTSCRLFTVY